MNKFKINSHNQMQPVDSKSRYMSYNTMYDLTNFYDFKNKTCERNLERVIGSIKNRELEMNIEKQNRHIMGAFEYRNNKSFFTCSLNELESLVFNNIDNALLSHKCIVVNLNKNIGIVKDENGNILGSTKYVKLHVSKTGYHVVPRKEIKK